MLHVQGFKLLYQYQKENVEFNLQHFLAGRSPLFQVDAREPVIA
jgi:hypothetical protein